MIIKRLFSREAIFFLNIFNLYLFESMEGRLYSEQHTTNTIQVLVVFLVATAIGQEAIIDDYPTFTGK